MFRVVEGIFMQKNKIQCAHKTHDDEFGIAAAQASAESAHTNSVSPFINTILSARL